MLAEERIDKVKKILKAFVQWILENSYKLSLAGLYIACLVTVNLMNAGYCKSCDITSGTLITRCSAHFHLLRHLPATSDTSVVDAGTLLLQHDNTRLRVELLVDQTH